MTSPQPSKAASAPQHLRAAGWAVLVTSFLGAAAWFISGAVVASRASSLETWADPVRSRGMSVLQARLRAPRTVAFFGSSELAYDVKNRVDRFFATEPNGFSVVPIGGKAMTPLIQALAIQALGPELRDRPIVVSLSPFTPELAARRQDWFAGNFSRLHASIALTKGGIPAPLRRETARQLLLYTYALASDPVLKLTAHVHSVDSPLSVAPSALLSPIAWLDRLWLTAVDRIVGARDVVQHQARAGDAEVVATPVNWVSLERAARDEYALVSGSNRYGFHDRFWQQAGVETMARRKPIADSLMARSLDAWPALSELETLVHSAQAAGAKVLVVNLPYNGAFLDAIGISAAARATYYNRIRAEAERLGINLVDYREYDMDRALLQDDAAHLSPVGWIFVNRSVNDFVHDSAP